MNINYSEKPEQLSEDMWQRLHDLRIALVLGAQW
jgi:hypothetical protein